MRIHSGVIAAFGLHIVKHGLASADMGRSLNGAHEQRMVADYRGDMLEPAIVAGAIAEGERFHRVMGALVEAHRAG